MRAVAIRGVGRLLGGHGGLDLTVHDEHEGGTDGTESVGTGTLEESRHALVGDDLGEAVHGSLVHPVGLWLLGLHLETTTDGIEWVGGEGGTEGGGLGTTELDGNTLDTVVLGELWWDHANESIVDSEVSSTERNDTDHGNTETVVETHDSGWTGGGLLETVTEALEGTLAGTDIGGETGTGIVKWVDNGEGTGTGETTGGHVDGEERPEVLLWGVLWEHSLDGVLEGKVESLGWEVTEDVDEVTAPESADTLLSRDAGEAVTDTGVTLDLAGDNPWVSILWISRGRVSQPHITHSHSVLHRRRR